MGYEEQIKTFGFDNKEEDPSKMGTISFLLPADGDVPLLTGATKAPKPDAKDKDKGDDKGAKKKKRKVKNFGASFGKASSMKVEDVEASPKLEPAAPDDAADVIVDGLLDDIMAGGGGGGGTTSQLNPLRETTGDV